MRDQDSTVASAPHTGFHDALVVDGLCEVVLTVSTIRLGTLTGVRDWWRFEPVPEGALALLRQVSGGQPVPLRAGIAREDGLLYELDPNDRASRSSDVVLRLRAPADYLLWWTLDASLYADALEDPAILETEGTTLLVKQRRPADNGPLWDELKELQLDASVRDVVCHHILHRHAFHEDPSSPIFDVTPESVRTLFKVEFMQWYVRRSQEISANNLATFHHAAAMIEAAEKGLKDSCFERRARELFPSEGERRVFECFRDYAWRCAATGIDHDLFVRSIEMNGPLELEQGGLPMQTATDAGVPELALMETWLEAAT